MEQTATNPSLCKQFEIWKLKFPIGTHSPTLYVLVVSQTDLPTFFREPYVTALPLYAANFQHQMLPEQVQLPFIRGGQASLHQLPFDCLIATHGIFTILKVNLESKVAYLNDDIQRQVMAQLKERLGLL